MEIEIERWTGATWVTRCSIGRSDGEDYDDAPIEHRWAWPMDWTPGLEYDVLACPSVYFRISHDIPATARKGDTVEVRGESGPDIKRAVWVLTGERHPTEDAILGHWPD
jgi:hypothetical protein